MSIKIPTLGPQQSIRNIPTQIPDAPVVGGASAQAISNLGRDMAGFAQDLLRKRRQSDSLNYQAKNRSEFMLSLHEASRDASESFNPNDPESSIVDPVKDRMQRHLDKILGKAPDSETADAFRRTAEDMLTRFEIDADQKQHELRLQVGISNYDESIQTSGRGVVLNPDEKSAMQAFNDAEEVAALQAQGGVWSVDFAKAKSEAARSTMASSLLMGFARKGDSNAYSRGLSFLRGDSELLKGLKPEEVARFGSQFEKGLKQAQTKEANIFISQFNTLTDQLSNGSLNPSDPSTRSLINRMESSIRSSEDMSDFVREQRLAQLDLTKKASEIFHANKYSNFSESDVSALSELGDKSASDIRKALAGTAFADLSELSANNLKDLAGTLQTNFSKALSSRYKDGAGYALGGLNQVERETSEQALLGLLEIPSSAEDSASISESFQQYALATSEMQRSLGLDENEHRNLIPDNFAKSIAQNLNNMRDPQVGARYLDHIRSMTGKHFNSVLHDVISRGDLPDEYRTLSFVNPGDSRAVERVLEAINEKDKIAETFKARFGQDGNLDKLLGGPFGGRMRGNLQDMEDDLADMFSKGQFFGGDIGHKEVSDVIRNMTMAQMARGVPGDRALESSRKTVFPGEIYSDRNSTVHIPNVYTDIDPSTGRVTERPVDVSAVKDLMSFGKNSLRVGTQRGDSMAMFLELGADIPSAEYDRLGLIDLPPAERLFKFYDLLNEGATWVSNEKRDGLVLQMDDPDELGFPVSVQSFKGGRIEVKFSEISEGRIPGFGPEIMSKALDAVSGSASDPQAARNNLERFLSETDSPRVSLQHLLRRELSPEQRSEIVESLMENYRKRFEGPDGRSASN